MTKFLSRWTAFIASILLISSLSGCAAVVFTGGAVSGTMAATDRRTLGTQTEDKVIMLKAESAASNIVGKDGHVNVTSFNRKVLLTGEVANHSMRQAVSNAVSKIDNVQSVINELIIAAPSSFASRSSDSFITAKVATSFLNEENLYSHSLKTVTENGVVFLMGRVTKKEGDLAARVAGGVDGVQKVVKVFEYISEQELQQLSEIVAPKKEAQDKAPDEYSK